MDVVYLHFAVLSVICYLLIYMHFLLIKIYILIYFYIYLYLFNILIKSLKIYTLHVTCYIPIYFNKMGRKTTNPVTKMFFKYNINTNESICTIPECVNPVRSGNHAGNLENHVKTFHKNEYILLLNEKEKNAMKLKHNESVCSTSTVAKVSNYYR